jgi:cell division protein FtsI (penicillin-binding protein 3)
MGGAAEESAEAALRAERQLLVGTKHRIFLMFLAFAFSFTLVGWRLVELGLTEPQSPNLSNLLDISTAVHRPDILDRRGRLVATDIKGATAYADPLLVVDRDELVEQVASVLPDLDTRDLAKRLRQAGRRFVGIRRELTPRQQAELHELGLPGLGFIEEYRRVYPLGPAASHVVGHVDVDNKGLAGIEKFVDDNPQLSMLARESQDESAAVTLTLDLGVQHVVREELQNAMRIYRAKGAAGIVVDVNTGEILSMVSLPDYDSNRREQALDKERANRFTAGVYEMGSVFKVFTVAGALDAGTVTMRGGYDATSPIRIGRFSIGDFHGKKRWLSTPEIFIYSSNIGTAKMAVDLGIERHRAFLSRLGLLNRMRTELGHTAFPLVPANWQTVNTMTIAFGHGISVTPLQFVAASLPLFNGGMAVTPTLLPRSAQEAQASAERVLKKSTSDQMTALMRLNVQKGTGRRADAEGYRVGGKTGTAEKVVGGRYDKSALLTSFLSVFPADDPGYVVLVMLDEPQRVPESNNERTAGVNAAPTTRKIVERIAPILGVAPKLDEKAAFDADLLASY